MKNALPAGQNHDAEHPTKVHSSRKVMNQLIYQKHLHQST